MLNAATAANRQGGQGAQQPGTWATQSRRHKAPKAANVVPVGSRVGGRWRAGVGVGRSRERRSSWRSRARGVEGSFFVVEQYITANSKTTPGVSSQIAALIQRHVYACQACPSAPRVLAGALPLAPLASAIRITTFPSDSQSPTPLPLSSTPLPASSPSHPFIPSSPRRPRPSLTPAPPGRHFETPRLASNLLAA
ncbi:uncharacterized protein BDZ99DRAFT_570725 [Mytilinidion resinicola]|uniref:Uncharacterized protein n=1 Tax=Mytilinidion resinicola TaxID=574789 RepID=A0A6A6YNE4_9PEZI|nr:uncharacterized protein BDZ99DRAFT_570725 [Mytilinidion resinicola]KAF2810103.1 hypothetical protein BDZ99DRAFT_570725 [Mytilinidion resinicola]